MLLHGMRKWRKKMLDTVCAVDPDGFVLFRKYLNVMQGFKHRQ